MATLLWLPMTLLRSQFSVNFDETLHHRLEPKKDRVRWGSKSDHSLPYFSQQSLSPVGRESVEHLKDAIEFADPSYHVTGTSFSCTFKFADSHSPLLCPGMGAVSPKQAQLLSILCWNFRIFVAKTCHANRGWSGTNFTSTVKFADPDNPLLGSRMGSYLPYKPSYSQFCVQIMVVGCHGNKGQSGVNLEDTIRLPDPENPQFGANIVHVSSKVPEL